MNLLIALLAGFGALVFILIMVYVALIWREARKVRLGK